MKISGEIEALFSVLRQSAKPEPVSAIEKLIEDAPDRELCRINALAFAAEHKLDEEDVIAAFLHSARRGIFDMSWNILCPGCGGVLDSGTTLKTVNQAEYRCALCPAVRCRYRWRTGRMCARSQTSGWVAISITISTVNVHRS